MAARPAPPCVQDGVKTRADFESQAEYDMYLAGQKSGARRKTQVRGGGRALACRARRLRGGGKAARGWPCSRGGRSRSTTTQSLPRGTRAQREKAKEANREKQKVDTQLGQIRELMEQKGHAHTTAFERPGRSKAAQQQAEGPVSQKKRRI